MVEKQLQIEASATSNGVHQQPPPVGEIQLFLHDYKSFNMLTCLDSLVKLVSALNLSLAKRSLPFRTMAVLWILSELTEMKVQLGPIPFWSIHMSHQLFVIIVGKC
jgi:hypothetical protein